MKIILCFFIGFNFFVNDDYITYNRTINQAESYIVKNNFEDALGKYEEALNYVNYGYAKDYYNAAFIASYVKDTLTTIRYLDSCIVRGVPQKWIKKSSKFDWLKSTDNWNEFIKRIPDLKNKYEARVNSTYSKKLYQIFDKDQKSRSWFNAKFKKKKMREVDEEGFKQLNDLINTYGFPSERKIGNEDWALNNMTIRILFMHYVQSTMDPSFFEGLKNEVLKGNLHPNNYAHIIDRIKIKDGYGTVIIWGTPIGDNLSNMPENYQLTPTEIKTINKRRYSIGLETIKEKQEKIILFNELGLYIY